MNTPAPLNSSRDTRFVWRGVCSEGTHRRGTLIAPDAATAHTMLKRDKLFVVELTARGPAPRPQAGTGEVTRFTRQLASLLRAGLPSRRRSNYWRKRLRHGNAAWHASSADWLGISPAA